MCADAALREQLALLQAQQAMEDSNRPAVSSSTAASGNNQELHSFAPDHVDTHSGDSPEADPASEGAHDGASEVPEPHSPATSSNAVASSDAKQFPELPSIEHVNFGLYAAGLAGEEPRASSGFEAADDDAKTQSELSGVEAPNVHMRTGRLAGLSGHAHAANEGLQGVDAGDEAHTTRGRRPEVALP